MGGLQRGSARGMVWPMTTLALGLLVLTEAIPTTPSSTSSVSLSSSTPAWWTPIEFVLSSSSTFTSSPETLLTITYDAKPEASNSECIGAFSHTKAPWRGGNSGEDALTWYSAPHRHDFTFRAGVFARFPHTNNDASGGARTIAKGSWHPMKVQLTTKAARYYVDGNLRMSARLLSGDVPTRGHVGFMRYASDCSFRNLVVYKGTKVLYPRVAAHEEEKDGWVCDKTKNFIANVEYEQVDLTDACPHCDAHPVYDTSLAVAPKCTQPALKACKAKCDVKVGCDAFFYQRHLNGHEVCGFYSTPSSLAAVHANRGQWDGHQKGSQVCRRAVSPQQPPTAPKPAFVDGTISFQGLS